MEKTLLEILFPSGVQCLLCAAASHGEYLCEACRMQLDARRIAGEGDTAASVWRHEAEAAALVYRLKYDGIGDAARLMAEAIAQRLPQLAEDTVITWVPASDKRRRERGVDHGRMLAEALADCTGFPARQLLKRTGERHTQQGLDRAQRLENVEGAFAPVGRAPDHVLLADDVLTTGATVRACAAVLRSAGAKQVCIVTANRAKEASGGPSNL